METPDTKKPYIMIGFLSLIVFVFLFWLIYFKDPATSSGTWTLMLPAVNAIFNTITASLLILGIIFIKKGRRDAHRNTMLLAVASSACFLVSYVLYHHFHGDTKFINPGPIKYVYFTILITHILLSIVQVPLIFTTLFLAWKQKWDRHGKVTKITFPIWLYVSVTGVLIYFFLKLFNH